MKTYWLKVPGSDIQNYYLTDAKIEFVVVEGTIVEVRDYNGDPVFNTEMIDIPIKKAELIAFRNVKGKFEKILKEKTKE